MFVNLHQNNTACCNSPKGFKDVFPIYTTRVIAIFMDFIADIFLCPSYNTMTNGSIFIELILKSYTTYFSWLMPILNRLCGCSFRYPPALANNICYLGGQQPYPGLILGLRSANERRRYTVTPSLIGWAQTLNQPWYLCTSVQAYTEGRNIYYIVSKLITENAISRRYQQNICHIDALVSHPCEIENIRMSQCVVRMRYMYQEYMFDIISISSRTGDILTHCYYVTHTRW